MNFKERFISCCIEVIIPACGISQNKLIPAVELGLSFSQFPSKNTVVTWQISDSTVVKTKPVLGSLTGISARLHLTEHLKFIFGCNYQLTGNKTYSYSQSTESPVYPVSFFKDWLDLKIHKVCVPVVLGYEFNLKKIKPMVFLGIKPNLILSAKLHEKSFHSQWTEPVETTTNLFSEKADYQLPKRIINQLSFGFLIPVGQNLKINLSYHLGNNHYVNTYWIQGNYSRVPYDVKTSVKSSDYILSIQFDLIKPE